jgi:phage baseplate assembly protein W
MTLMHGQTKDPAKSFLGCGWYFPPKVDVDGSIADAVYEEDIDQAISIILGTNPGERVMRPNFGAGLNRFLFEPINSTTIEGLKRRVEEALVAWEPRIDVKEVSVEANRPDHTRLLIDVKYKVRATNTVRNFVYPFYLQEGTPV